MTSLIWSISVTSPIKRFFNTRSEINHMVYKILRNAVNNAVRRAKCEFFIKVLTMAVATFGAMSSNAPELGRMKSTSAPWPCHSSIAAKLSANLVNNKLIEIIHETIGNRVSPLAKHASSFIVHGRCAQFSLHHVSAKAYCGLSAC